MSSAQVHRPSEGRRAALRQAEGEMGGGVPLVSNFFSIDRYYAAADKVMLNQCHVAVERDVVTLDLRRSTDQSQLCVVRTRALYV